jgi:hypothetical protein
VRSSFKYDNFHVRLQPANHGSRTHAGCITAYHYEPCHYRPPALLRFREFGYPKNSVPDIVPIPAFQDKNGLGAQEFHDFFRFTA